MVNPTIDLKTIHAKGGDRRGAFEELSFQLFARYCSTRGSVIRRHGAGGDAGLEGVIVDAKGRSLAGIQAKFFAEKLESTQWRNLDESILMALASNAVDSTLEEIFVTLPRNLTKAQEKKWNSLCQAWATKATSLNYSKPIKFTLWDESRLHGMLLTHENRGFLLYYFGFPNFNAQHCRRITTATVSDLGERYLPSLHTATDTEEKIHVFMRSDDSRHLFLENAREYFRMRAMLPERGKLPASLHEAFDKASDAWRAVLQYLGDGNSLPSSFIGLSAAVGKAADALLPLMEGLSALLLPIKPNSDNHGYYTPSRGPFEEVLLRFDNWESKLRSFARYLGENAIADQSCLLLTGVPGTGKSHILADVCSRYSEQGGIVLFLEGHKFATNEPPWTQLMRWVGFPGSNPRDLIETLSAMAAETSMPGLICIDALNETTSNRSLWRNGILDFASMLTVDDQIKLIVSCRSDYLELTLPILLREGKAPNWAFVEHDGLGVNVFEAFPKFIAAYNVLWGGLPPLTSEFQNPLFLKIFCEAYSGRRPEAGSLSLGSILREFTQRKAELIGHRIDCNPNQVKEALRDLAKAIQSSNSLEISHRDARKICEANHSSAESSQSLYGALISESILAEFPGHDDALGSSQLVRFTYERIWDYYISLCVLPHGGQIPEVLSIKLRDANWRSENVGLICMLHIRFPEEGHGELCDSFAISGSPEFETLQDFLWTIPWRTHKTVSSRTLELFELATNGGEIQDTLDLIVPLASNPSHPWNAMWLHRRLKALSLAELDRKWTLWVNEQFLQFLEDSPLRELLAWAERAHLETLADENRLLLATALAWCASTTVVDARQRLAAALTRLVAGRTHLAARLVELFLDVNDPYVREWVLLAAAGAAQHAPFGDACLGELAQVVYSGTFGNKFTQPHVLIRHYASEICQEADKKGVSPVDIVKEKTRPPFRSSWPKIWSESKCENVEKSIKAKQAYALFRSVVPDAGSGPGYGDWGRYVMEALVTNFLPQKLSEPLLSQNNGYRTPFDARITRRYVIQRVFEIGWDAESPDLPLNSEYSGQGRKVERLSKKYQWIALYEFIGFLCDHYCLKDFGNSVVPFSSARQLTGIGLLDPFVIEPSPDQVHASRYFAKPTAPWWRGYLDLLPRPLSMTQQSEQASGCALFDPKALLQIHDEHDAWFSLSASHRWTEPKPVWTSGESNPHVGITVALQSYLVRPSKMKALLHALSSRDFDRHSRLWLEEPEFGQPLTTMKTFPLQQIQLRSRCNLDEQEASKSWGSGACSSTCRFTLEEDGSRSLTGSLPSPQLAEIGNLHWLGRAFDFASQGDSSPLVCHVGKGHDGACIVRRDALLTWLGASDMRLVWRIFIEKFLHGDLSEQNHYRVYWGTFHLQLNGDILPYGGATCNFSHGPGPDEPLPWIN